MNINGFTVRFTINGEVSDVSSALDETYLPTFNRVADKEVQLLCALETLAEDLRDGGNAIDFSLRAA